MSSTFKMPSAVKKVAVIFLLLPPLLFILASLLLLAYTFIPVNMKVEDIPPSENITILAHGIYDSPETWSGKLANVVAENDPTESVVALNWSKYADSVFRCSVNGLRMGKKIGKKLAADSSLKTLHLVGHSCGAFVAYGICQRIKRDAPEILVQTTYLDPVSNYGGVFNTFGIENFGSCADFSDTYIDRDDNVRGSNQRLPHSYTLDVTAIRKQYGFEGNPHLWPAEYYTLLFQTGEPLLLKKDRRMAEKYPPGKTESLR